MTSNIGFAGRIAIFEIGAAALVEVVALSILKPRPVQGFEEPTMSQPQQPKPVRWADYKSLVLRASTVVQVTGALLVLAGRRVSRP